MTKPKKKKPQRTEPKPLTPPDKKQCQAEISNGVNFMTLGGRREMVRCTEIPVVIVEETKPGPDGQLGSMSLCEGCFEVFQDQNPLKGKFRTTVLIDVAVP